MPSLKGTDRIRSVVGWLLLLGGIGAVFAATLWPFNFAFRPLTWGEFATSFKARPSSTLDAPLNILLFTPLGLGAALIIRGNSAPRSRKALWIAIFGFILSLCVESLQVYLPRRRPNVSDLTTNTLGAVLGFVLAEAWQKKGRLFQRLFHPPARRYLAVALTVYLAISAVAWYALVLGMSPSGWDENYQLTLGSELTNRQPWRGTIRQILLMDRALDWQQTSELLNERVPPELGKAIVATYPLVSQNGVGEQEQRVVGFESNGDANFRVGREGVTFLGRGGLTTGAPLRPLADRVNRSRQFTLAVTVEPLDLRQDGPARILTISSDPWRRNLNLGQSGQYLTVEWRSFLTDKHGAMLELFLPGVFLSTAPQTIVVSFDRLDFRVRTSLGVSSGVRMTPEIGLAAILHDGQYWPLRVDGAGFIVAALLMSGIVYFPMGLIAGAWSSLMSTKAGKVAAALAGSVVPAILLEGILAFTGKCDVRIAMVGLGFLVNLAAQLLVHTARQRWPAADEGLSPAA